MSREQDIKIDAWMGIESHDCNEDAYYCEECENDSENALHYTTRSIDAVILLDVLAEKNYQPDLYLNEDQQWKCLIYDQVNIGISGGDGNGTIAGAISSAVLELIDKDTE